MTETNEERLARLETKDEANDRRWNDYVDRVDEHRKELLDWMVSLDGKVDEMLIREAGRVGERKAHRNMAARVASLVSLVVTGVISVIINAFK